MKPCQKLLNGKNYFQQNSFVQAVKEILMKKHARFFCENCQTEVKGNARFCGHCGRFFAAVKCPACGKTGASHTFAHGCPNCGYAVGSSKSSNDKENSFQENSKINKKNSRKKFNFQKIFSGFDKNDSSKKYSEDSLPLWIYLVAIIFLVVILVVFFQTIKL